MIVDHMLQHRHLCRYRDSFFDLKLAVGRNWLGYDDRFAVVRHLASIANHPLRLFPALCSNLYSIG
jgi:hypothetical protein